MSNALHRSKYTVMGVCPNSMLFMMESTTSHCASSVECFMRKPY